jgi:hypothetical protein
MRGKISRAETPTKTGEAKSEGIAIKRLSLDAVSQAGLISALLTALEEGAHVVLTAPSAGIVGVVVAQTDYELLRADADLVRDGGRYEYLRKYTGDEHLMTPNDVFGADYETL